MRSILEVYREAEWFPHPAGAGRSSALPVPQVSFSALLRLEGRVRTGAGSEELACNPCMLRVVCQPNQVVRKGSLCGCSIFGICLTIPSLVQHIDVSVSRSNNLAQSSATLLQERLGSRLIFNPCAGDDQTGRHAKVWSILSCGRITSTGAAPSAETKEL